MGAKIFSMGETMHIKQAVFFFCIRVEIVDILSSCFVAKVFSHPVLIADFDHLIGFSVARVGQLAFFFCGFVVLTVWPGAEHAIVAVAVVCTDGAVFTLPFGGALALAAALGTIVACIMFAIAGGANRIAVGTKIAVVAFRADAGASETIVADAVLAAGAG